MDLGGTYDVRTTIVEKQGRDSIGMGVGWNRHQEGTVNTGAERWGYDNRMRHHLAKHRDDLEAGMKSNPVALAMLEKAFEDTGTTHLSKEEVLAGKTESSAMPNAPRVDRAATLRYQLGREEHDHFNAKVKEAAADDIVGKIYHLEVLADTEVTGIDVAKPLRPAVQLSAQHGTPQPVHADVVRLNTGTTVASPLKANQADVAAHSYVGPMSKEKLGAFLESKGLLDENGKLKPGTKVLTGGSSLSVYDQLLALDKFMGLMESDPASPYGYRITDEAKDSHKDSILITSATPGKWVPPRHTETPRWTQDLRPIAGAREQHALFLHNDGEEVYKAWDDIQVATVAAATGRTPKQVRVEGTTTEEVLAVQMKETEKHLKASGGESEKTLYGAKRQAALSTLLGYGMEPDLAAASAEMNEAAPLTFKGRAEYLIHRAQLRAITNPESPVSKNNRALISVGNQRMQEVLASPVLTHALAPQLMEAGIARYTPGSYGNINADGEARSLSFVDQKGEKTEHDFFLVSPTFQRSANPAERSLEGQVDPIDVTAPSVARVGQNRMLSRFDGAPLNVEDYGLSGRGVWGSEASLVGVYGPDVSNRESAVQVAPGLAYRRMAQQHLAAAGRLDPVGDVEAMYTDLYPDEEAYRNEVEAFKGNFDSAMEKAAYLRTVESRTNENPQLHLEFYEKARTPEGRREIGRVAYEEERAQIEAFSPTGRDQYFSRFLDAPDHIHEQVYLRALSEAKLSLVGAEGD